MNNVKTFVPKFNFKYNILLYYKIIKAIIYQDFGYNAHFIYIGERHLRHELSLPALIQTKSKLSPVVFIFIHILLKSSFQPLSLIGKNCSTQQ